MDIETAIRDARVVFQLKGARLAAFAEGLSKPLMAVCWNNLDDDVEAKEAMLKDIVGEEMVL